MFDSITRRAGNQKCPNYYLNLFFLLDLHVTELFFLKQFAAREVCVQHPGLHFADDKFKSTLTWSEL